MNAPLLKLPKYIVDRPTESGSYCRPDGTAVSVIGTPVAAIMLTESPSWLMADHKTKLQLFTRIGVTGEVVDKAMFPPVDLPFIATSIRDWYKAASFAPVEPSDPCEMCQGQQAEPGKKSNHCDDEACDNGHYRGGKLILLKVGKFRFDLRFIRDLLPLIPSPTGPVEYAFRQAGSFGVLPPTGVLYLRGDGWLITVMGCTQTDWTPIIELPGVPE